MNKLYTLLFVLVAVSFTASAQKDSDARVIVITTDGYRWQELFNGIDTSIVKIKRFHHGDSARLIKQYYAPTVQERREKLMPFFWGKLAAAGQIHGNRAAGSQVDNANPYWFSYPGYSEILTGQVDTAVNSNDYKPNPEYKLF